MKKIKFPYKVYKGGLYPIKIGYVKFSAKIGFSPSLGADFNLLGQANIFDRFIVSFDKRNGIVSFQPY